MPRIRSIKPQLWGDQRLAECSRDARLLFIGLISFADDHGRFLGSLQAIGGYIYPNDPDVTPAKLTRWLRELTTLRGDPPEPLVVLYDVGRVRYGAIPKWSKHQRINRPQPSSLPPPPIQ